MSEPRLVLHLPTMRPRRRMRGRQVAMDGGVAAAETQTPWLACHQPHEGGRRCNGGRFVVGWLFLMTVLLPPHMGRGCHPHHWGG